jgi:hypothetical protein
MDRHMEIALKSTTPNSRIQSPALPLEIDPFDQWLRLADSLLDRTSTLRPGSAIPARKPLRTQTA